jgi:hypothetical protein
MRALTSVRLDLWIRGTGILAVVALAWAIFLPEGPFWNVVLAAGLIGAAVATAILVRHRSIPSLAQVITSAEAEPLAVLAGGGYTSGAGFRPSPRGEGKP